MKTYTPDVTSGFERAATVTSGDFCYKCKICKSDTAVTVTVNSTKAEGLRLTYNGTVLNFLYDDMKYQMNADSAPKANPAVAVFDVFDYLLSPDIRAKKTEDGFRYDGKTDLGRFVLYQNQDGSFASLHFYDTDLLIEFDDDK